MNLASLGLGGLLFSIGVLPRDAWSWIGTGSKDGAFRVIQFYGLENDKGMRRAV